MRNNFFLFILIFIPIILFAQVDSSADTMQTYNFDPIIVTATRVEVARSSVAPSVSVIPNDVLNANTQKSILSLVSEQVPGVFVPERGVLGYGIQTTAGQINVRGVSGSPTTEVLMLIDGRPQYAGLFGHPLSDGYLSASAERVEIIRGPASVMYGTNAMGGVVNIITDKSMQSGFSTDLTTSYGSYNSAHIGGKVRYKMDNLSAIVSLHREQTDGHRPESEFRSNSGYAKVSYAIDDRYNVIVDGSATAFRTNDPGVIAAPNVGNWFDVLRSYVGVSVENSLPYMSGAVRFLYNYGDHAVYDGFRSKDYMTAILAYQTLRLFPENTLTLGVDYKHYGGDARNIVAGSNFGEYFQDEVAFYVSTQQVLMQQLILNGGLRYEHSNIFGDVVVPQIGAAFHVSKATTVRGTVSKGFRSPTIAELYLFPVNANPALQPEHLWNYELGVSQRFGDRVSTDLTLFQTEGSNLIRHPVWIVPYKNSGSFIHRGVEISGTILATNNLHLHGSYSYLDREKEISSAPWHKIFVNAEYSYNIATLNLNIQHIEKLFGERYTALIPLGNYTLVGAKLSARVLPQLSINFSVDNLLDESYQTIFGYPMPGTTATVGIQAGL